MPIATLDDIRAKIGQPIGVSDWIEVGQDRIEQFADATDDHQFIHVDQDMAAKTPFGGTIAHGFLSLSLLSRMAADVMIIPDTTRMAVSLRTAKILAWAVRSRRGGPEPPRCIRAGPSPDGRPPSWPARRNNTCRRCGR